MNHSFPRRCTRFITQVNIVKKQATKTARKQQAAATRLNEWRTGDKRREWWRKAELEKRRALLKTNGARFTGTRYRYIGVEKTGGLDSRRCVWDSERHENFFLPIPGILAKGQKLGTPLR
jgi:hypothetical protein